MKVLVFEPSHRGHRYQYVKLLISELLTLDVDITLASSASAFRSEEYGVHLASFETSFERYECVPIDRSNVWRAAKSTLTSYLTTCTAVQPQHSYITVGGGLTQLLGCKTALSLQAALNAPIEAVHFGGGFGYQSEGNWMTTAAVSLKRRLSLMAPLERYLHVDPWQLDDLCRKNPAFASRSALLPDPVVPLAISKNEARRELGLPLDCTILGCAGRMDRRKGIDLLIESFAKAVPRLPDDVRLLLFGKFTAQVMEVLLAQPQHVQDKIIRRDRLLTDREFDLAIPAMDVVCAAYVNHPGSSAIVLRAMAAERPLIGSSRAWIGRIIPLLKAGITCDVSDQESLQNALLQVGEIGTMYKPSSAMKRYLQFQTASNFKATLTSLLRTRLGLPPHPDMISWQDVSRDIGFDSHRNQ